MLSENTQLLQFKCLKCYYFVDLFMHVLICGKFSVVDLIFHEPRGCWKIYRDDKDICSVSNLFTSSVSFALGTKTTSRPRSQTSSCGEHCGGGSGFPQCSSDKGVMCAKDRFPYPFLKGKCEVKIMISSLPSKIEMPRASFNQLGNMP